jgi:hypothetical protein
VWGAVHDLTVERTGVADPDSEGRGGVVVTGRTTVRGSVHFLSSAERDVAARFAEGVEAVARLPLGTDVSASDRIVTDVAGLEGTWEIAAVRRTPLHLRCLLRRAVT